MPAKIINSREFKVLEREIEKLRMSIEDLKGSLTRQRDTIFAMKRDSTKNNEKIKKIYDLANGKFYDEAKVHSKNISDLYQVAFLKTIVITEVINAYSFRKNVRAKQIFHMQGTIVACYELEDKWWIKKSGYTLKQWIDTFLRYAKETDH